MGDVGKLPSWHRPCAMGQDVCMLRMQSSEHSTEFLAVTISVSQVSRNSSRIDGMVQRSSDTNVSRSRNFADPAVHRSPEQRAIATALSDVDALLGGLDRLIAKKRDLKQAAMQQLLTGQTRLPGFHGEWEVKTLGELARSRRASGSDDHRADTATATAIRDIHERRGDVAIDSTSIHDDVESRVATAISMFEFEELTACSVDAMRRRHVGSASVSRRLNDVPASCRRQHCFATT